MIVTKVICRLQRNTYINLGLLKINNYFNVILEFILAKSYKTRARIYDEGSLQRPANDHDISVFYRWKEQGEFGWTQTAVFSILAINCFDEKKVLDIGCADGWFFRNFYYALDNIHYLGCDINSYFIREANKKIHKERYSFKDASFVEADITAGLPAGDFTTILWHGSICMFEVSVRRMILNMIAKSLAKKSGILVGSATMVDLDQNIWNQFIEPYECVEELRDELSLFFCNVCIIRVDIHSVIFLSGNGELPIRN